MSLFISRFRELLISSGKQQKDICKDLGISKQKLSKWKTGYNEPNLDDLIIIAQYFGVTSDYLLGLEDETGTKIKNDIQDNHGNITFNQH